MANGSGAAIAGLIIGIVIATQVGALESADVDVDANTAPDENVDSNADDVDSNADDDDSTPQAVPTQVNGGLPGDESTGSLTDLYSSLDLLPRDFGLEPTDTPDVLDILDRTGDRTTFCAASAPTSCCPMPATGPTPWLRLTC